MDYSCSNEIINESTKTIGIEVFYDKSRVDSLKKQYGSNKESASSFLTKQGNISGQQYQIDSLAFSIFYSLNKNDTVTINRTIGGRLVEPEYTLIKKIVLLSGENSITINNMQLPKIFKRVNNDFLWIYKVN